MRIYQQRRFDYLDKYILVAIVGVIDGSRVSSRAGYLASSLAEGEKALFKNNARVSGFAGGELAP
jgi:hypothetical protein